MSNSEDERDLGREVHERLSKVSPELLSEFLYKRGVHVVKCLMCGSEDIGIPQTQELIVYPAGSGTKVYVDYVRVESAGPNYSIMKYQYRLICRNCGFISNLAVWPVLTWIEEEKESRDGK
ncbi:hypothetical protein [Pectobacterium zantedeschiae]|uniref:Uncharacterized protein n=1 Tax=Pectobacterium zantedeschiae TaxID=2034769 RepID=A0A9X8JLD5_9GAMM|nr:hypothetical protein [Pectobacterium zantedeschiae]RYC44599.1 hypothetical protein CLR69_06160 [Pectobacterium zantedeschiae]RYC49757.1 hypothetical protein CTN06_01960 [Pectobacterium zantedeschiae]